MIDFKCLVFSLLLVACNPSAECGRLAIFIENANGYSFQELQESGYCFSSNRACKLIEDVHRINDEMVVAVNGQSDDGKSLILGCDSGEIVWDHLDSSGALAQLEKHYTSLDTTDAMESELKSILGGILFIESAAIGPESAMTVSEIYGFLNFLEYRLLEVVQQKLDSELD